MDAWLDVVLPSESGTFKMPGWIPLSVISAIAAGTHEVGKLSKQWDLKITKK
jgi:PiT family inorganic phosphate transporter